MFGFSAIAEFPYSAADFVLWSEIRDNADSWSEVAVESNSWQNQSSSSNTWE